MHNQAQRKSGVQRKRERNTFPSLVEPWSMFSILSNNNAPKFRALQVTYLLDTS